MRLSTRVLAIVALVGVSTLAVGLPASSTSLTRGGFTTVALASPTSPPANTTVVVTANVVASTTRRVLVDVEIYNREGVKVHQRGWDNERFTANVPREFPNSVAGRFRAER